VFLGTNRNAVHQAAADIRAKGQGIP